MVAQRQSLWASRVGSSVSDARGKPQRAASDGAAIGVAGQRSAYAVVEAAAKLLAPASISLPSAASLQSAGLVHDWQLARLEQADWASIGVNVGLKAAVLSVLDEQPRRVPLLCEQRAACASPLRCT